MIKPQNCQMCPVSKITGKEITCKCLPKLKAKLNDPVEVATMYKNCPLVWENQNTRSIRNEED